MTCAGTDGPSTEGRQYHTLSKYRVHCVRTGQVLVLDIYAYFSGTDTSLCLVLSERIVGLSDTDTSVLSNCMVDWTGTDTSMCLVLTSADGGTRL